LSAYLRLTFSEIRYGLRETKEAGLIVDELHELIIGIVMIAITALVYIWNTLVSQYGVGYSFDSLYTSSLDCNSCLVDYLHNIWTERKTAI
jgi:hypothetical protein